MKTSNIKVYGTEKEVFEILRRYAKEKNKVWYKNDFSIKNATTRIDENKMIVSLKIDHPNNYFIVREMDLNMLESLILSI